MLITELGVFKFDRELRKMTLTELAEGVSLEEIKAKTEGEYEVSGDLKLMD